MLIKHHKLVKTEWAQLVLRARLSLNETQTEFAKRLEVNWVTVHRWETGKVRSASRIHAKILRAITANLAANGQLLPIEAFDAIYRKEAERKNELALVQ